MKLLQVESNHPLKKSDAKRYAFPADVLNVSILFSVVFNKDGISDHKPITGLELNVDHEVDILSKVSLKLSKDLSMEVPLT